jgi:hypothetical protein
MWKRRLVIRALAVVALACILVVLVVRFADVPAFVSAFENSPDHVHVVVTSVVPLPSGMTMSVIFDQQSSQEASIIYRRLTSGADVTGKPLLCPNVSATPYYRYVLTFSRGGTKFATATDDAVGCGVFVIEHLDGSTTAVFWNGDHEQCFWDDLHELVNAPEPISLDTGDACSADNAFRVGIKF